MPKCIGLLMSLLLASANAEPLIVGLSSSGTRIDAVQVEASASMTTPASTRTVLLIGGLDGNQSSVVAVRSEVKAFEKVRARDRKIRLLAIPLANPDATKLQFPPTGIAYREQVESHALWRWIGAHAPDVVMIVGEDLGLAEALATNAVAEVGRVTVQRWSGSGDVMQVATAAIELSDAHGEMQRRLARTPHQLAAELSNYYGREFDQPLYIQALALSARLRLGHLQEVKRLAEPYVNGARNSLERPNSLVLAGHLVFTDLARRTGEQRYVDLVRKVADLGFDESGQMKESMPYHNEFSDSIFMGTVIAAQAGALTGEGKYFDMAARHVKFMQQLVLRSDGLYRHQPATDAAWGRGNGFAAIGLAMTLSEFPKDHPDYKHLLKSYRNHMKVLTKFQDADGLWHNVIDYPGAYAEYSATAMIGYAMLRGVRNGWLPKNQFQPLINKAWTAVLARTSSDGHMIDVCESTARMKSVDEYLKRAAILGPDPRGGAMAMMFATEMAEMH
jgi:unsaturated rhamnogalacturonyl hydrolase